MKKPTKKKNERLVDLYDICKERMLAWYDYALWCKPLEDILKQQKDEEIYHKVPKA